MLFTAETESTQVSMQDNENVTQNSKPIESIPLDINLVGLPAELKRLVH